MPPSSSPPRPQGQSDASRCVLNPLTQRRVQHRLVSVFVSPPAPPSPLPASRFPSRRSDAAQINLLGYLVPEFDDPCAYGAASVQTCPSKHNSCLKPWKPPITPSHSTPTFSKPRLNHRQGIRLGKKKKEKKKKRNTTKKRGKREKRGEKKKKEKKNHGHHHFQNPHHIRLPLPHHPRLHPHHQPSKHPRPNPRPGSRSKHGHRTSSFHSLPSFILSSHRYG